MPIYERTDKLDRYVSLEVAPELGYGMCAATWQGLPMGEREGVQIFVCNSEKGGTQLES